MQTEQTGFSLNRYTQNLNQSDNTARDGPIIEQQYSGLELEGQVKTARGSPQLVSSALNHMNFRKVQTRA